MGTTKQKNGDGHIIFHVGKELPAEGSNIMLVPGVQKAQGRGVYFSDEPRLKYSGGEHFREELEITPIFCIPMSGQWIRGKNKKKSGETSYHSDEKIVVLFGLEFFDSEINGTPVRYFYPSELSFFQEPDVKRKGRYITSQFSDRVLKGEVEFDEAIRQLREEYKATENHIDEKYILEKIQEAMNEGKLPRTKEINERLQELCIQKENSERMKINIR